VNSDGSSGTANPEDVWRRYEEEGCSIRVLHPQRWCDPLWKMLAALERYWNCSVGCNSYLTPADSQGFSPHWDDIEAIVLQIEGRKHWKLYKPRSIQEALPRYSSENFDQEDIGEPILEVELGPGDLLYMPRGLIHQAVSPPGEHSLHVTLSTNQFNTWSDLLEVALPRALELAAAEHCRLRMAPPRDYFQYMGVVHSDNHRDSRRQAFQMEVMQLAGLVLSQLPLDATADQLAKGFIKQRLPPPPLVGSRGGASGSSAAEKGTLTVKSKLRLAYPGCGRLCIEEDYAMLYHIFDNPRLMHMEGEKSDAEQEDGSDGGGGAPASAAEDSPPGVLTFPLDHAMALEQVLLLEGDESIDVGGLPLDSKKECLEVAQRLVDKGILVVAA